MEYNASRWDSSGLTIVNYFCKNCTARMINANSYQIGNCPTMIAETVSIREVMLSTIQMVHTNIIAKSDSQVTVYVITGENSSPMIKNLVQYIRIIVKHFEILCLVIYKKANREADYIVGKAHRCTTSTSRD